MPQAEMIILQALVHSLPAQFVAMLNVICYQWEPPPGVVGVLRALTIDICSAVVQARSIYDIPITYLKGGLWASMIFREWRPLRDLARYTLKV